MRCGGLSAGQVLNADRRVLGRMQTRSSRIRQSGILILTSVLAIAVVGAVALVSRNQGDSMPRQEVGAVALASRDQGDTSLANGPNNVEQRPLTPDDCPRGLSQGEPTYSDAQVREVLTPEAMALRYSAATNLEDRFPDIKTEVVNVTGGEAQVAFSSVSHGTVAMIFFKNTDLGWRINLIQECS